MKILIIEDEEKLAQTLARGLEKCGFAADFVLDGESGERRIDWHHNDYDLVVLDLMLPQKDGFEVLRTWRQKGITIPVLVLTARSSLEDKTAALEECGADDYLVKPFSFKELLARIHSLLRRPRASLPPKLLAKNLTLDTATREAQRDGKKIDLTLKEFSMLEYLLRHPNIVVNREDLYNHVWDFNDNSLSNTIDVHVKNLRKKIDHGHREKLLETIRGVGYRLVA